MSNTPYTDIALIAEELRKQRKKLEKMLNYFETKLEKTGEWSNMRIIDGLSCALDEVKEAIKSLEEI